MPPFLPALSLRRSPTPKQAISPLWASLSLHAVIPACYYLFGTLAAKAFYCPASWR